MYCDKWTRFASMDFTFRMELNKNTPGEQLSEQCGCKQPFSSSNTPMLICYDCQEIKCLHCCEILFGQEPVI